MGRGCIWLFVVVQASISDMQGTGNADELAGNYITARGSLLTHHDGRLGGRGRTAARHVAAGWAVLISKGEADETRSNIPVVGVPFRLAADAPVMV